MSVVSPDISPREQAAAMLEEVLSLPTDVVVPGRHAYQDEHDLGLEFELSRSNGELFGFRGERVARVALTVFFNQADYYNIPGRFDLTKPERIAVGVPCTQDHGPRNVEVASFGLNPSEITAYVREFPRAGEMLISSDPKSVAAMKALALRLAETTGVLERLQQAQ